MTWFSSGFTQDGLCRELVPNRGPSISLGRVGRPAVRSRKWAARAEAPRRAPPDRRRSTSPAPAKLVGATPTSAPKRRKAQPMMKERAELQSRELARVARAQLTHRANVRQLQPASQREVSLPYQLGPQHRQQPLPQQPEQGVHAQQGLPLQQAQQQQRDALQQQLRERQQSSAGTSTSGIAPRRLARPSGPATGGKAPVKRPPSARPPLQTAVRSNKARDWQVTRDWLIMELEDIRLDDQTFQDLARSCHLEQHWRPQVALYHQLGMSKADLCRLADSRRQLFNLSVPSVRSKLAFLRNELAMDDADIRKVLLKFPRFIEYKTERTVRPRLEFLLKHGVGQADLSKVVLRAPATMELSVEDTLEPRVAFLRQAVGLSQEAVGKVITRLPSVLTYSEDFMQQRIDFLLAAGLASEDLAKAVTSHPQVLHYRLEGMAERLRYLRSIGMTEEQVSCVLQRLPQLLSLDIRNNLMPKYSYLQLELGGDVRTVASYPAYFSLSLPLRIMPRHRYLQLVQPQKVWPFPMNYLKCSDTLFASNVANTPLDKFEIFKEQFVARRARDQLHLARR